MRSQVRDYELEIELSDDILGLPDRIIIRPNDENDYVWIYTKTQTTTYDKIPPRIIKTKNISTKETNGENNG